MKQYILAIDQSTQGTKGLLFDREGVLRARADLAHEQIVNERGWVEHDPREILRNTLAVCRKVTEKAGIDKTEIAAMAISNQRETSMMWNRTTGEPVYNAIVWQCGRAAAICERPEIASRADDIRSRTGIPLSPYFPAAKLCWLMENVPEARKLAGEGDLCCGTMDAWLVYSLTREHSFRTDYSNASRTQLFDITQLKWDASICALFGIPEESLPEVCMSDALFGHTTLGGWLEEEIPIHGVLGDSHGALFGQNCRTPGRVKATYGTGSSVMMNIGTKPRFSDKGLVTSLAWGRNGTVEYVYEGNLNYTGAVITWLKKEVGLIADDMEATVLARAANPQDVTYFVPAFTGLGAPYWDSRATGMFTGITRITGRAELVKAGLECIAYQITDLLRLMNRETGMRIETLMADGGPTASDYLMQLQSDLTGARVGVPELQELSGMGAAYAAGIAIGLYDETHIFDHVSHTVYAPAMGEEERTRRYDGWQSAVRQVLHRA